MHRLAVRLERLEDATAPGSRRRFLHLWPGETEAEARAADERTHGPVPNGTPVTIIVHTFRSPL